MDEQREVWAHKKFWPCEVDPIRENVLYVLESQK